jgi:hypothetical protein
MTPGMETNILLPLGESKSTENMSDTPRPLPIPLSIDDWLTIRRAWNDFAELYTNLGMGSATPRPHYLRALDDAMDDDRPSGYITTASDWHLFELAQINAGLGWPSPRSPTYSTPSPPREENEGNEGSGLSPSIDGTRRHRSRNSRSRSPMRPSGSCNDADGV